ncbi:GMC family oxidoreductase [Spongorhabdus nitratireducens]
MKVLDTEVLIVGSGVAGALIANKLAAFGKNVIILEAGDYVRDRAEYRQRLQAAGRQRISSAVYPVNPLIAGPDPQDGSAYYIQKGPVPFTTLYDKLVGGTTWRWLGSTPRFLPEDFQLYSRYGQACDWPIGYRDIESYYVEAEREMHVAGASNFGSPRSLPFPHLPIKQSYLDKVLSKAVNGLVFDGMEIIIEPIPQSRHHWCQGSHSCIPFCPVGAKYEAASHVELAKNNGAIVIEKAVAHHIETSGTGKIEAIRYLDWSGKDHRVTAKAFVIAANGIETPKLLLMSKNHKYRNGIANGSGMVGRNLMDHPVVLSWALSPEPVYPFRGPLCTSTIETTRRGEFRKDRGAFRIDVGNYGWSWPTGAPFSTVSDILENTVEPEAVKAKLADQVNRQLAFASLIEQLPHWKNNITPSPKKFDALGLPFPEVYFHYTDYEERGFEKARECHQKIFDYIGATEIQHHSRIFSAGHIMGTCRMGADHASSVVDANCRAHEHSNLYIAGSSVFSTAGTANPTLTLAALSLRVADTIQAEL